MKLECDDVPNHEIIVKIMDDDIGKDDLVGRCKIDCSEFFDQDGAYIEKEFALKYKKKNAGTVTLACWRGLKQKAEDEEVDEEKEARRLERKASRKGDNESSSEEDDSDAEYDE